MKVKEFSVKYGVPKELVYEASFMLGERFDFEPKDIAAEIRKIVERRIKVHRKHVERSERILQNLEGV